MTIEKIPSVSGNPGRFVFFKVSDASGLVRYFVRSSGDLNHLQIQKAFESVISRHDPEGRLTCETLGGAFIHILKGKKSNVININMKSLAVGPIKELSLLLTLLQENFPDFSIFHEKLEGATG